MVKLSALVAATAAALVASVTPALAEEATGPLTPEVNALMATQDELHKIAEKIVRGNGFSGVYVDAGSKTLNVYWKGKAPAKVTTEAIAARAKGLEVKVHPAKYSQAELRAEAARLAKENNSITGVAAKYDGSGLAVTQSSGPSLRSGLQSSVPLDVETGDVAPAAASRLRDESPFKGGAYVENLRNGQVAGSCSTGFAVTSNATGADKMLTAAHCGAAGSSFQTGNGLVLGTVDSRSVTWDTETIPVGSQPYSWIGESIQPESVGLPAVQYGLPVVGAARTFPGEWLCTSGAFSGTVCEIRAEQVGMSISLLGFGTVQDVVRAVHTGGGAAGGNGDSGGPVFSAVDQRLTARGTLTAISVASSELRPCYGVPAGNGRQCSRTIYFPDIFPQMAYHNVSIKTAP